MERNQVHVRHKKNPDVKRIITRANLAVNDKDWEIDPDFGTPQIEKKSPVVNRAVAETVIYKKPETFTGTTSESPFVKVTEEVKEEKQEVKEDVDPVLFNLRKEYEARTGKPAKKNWKQETLTAKIKELPE